MVYVWPTTLGVPRGPVSEDNSDPLPQKRRPKMSGRFMSINFQTYDRQCYRQSASPQSSKTRSHELWIGCSSRSRLRPSLTPQLRIPNGLITIPKCKGHLVKIAVRIEEGKATAVDRAPTDVYAEVQNCDIDRLADGALSKHEERRLCQILDWRAPG